MTLSSKQLQRDRAFERSRLILAELEAGQSGFTRHALMRLEAGDRTYGDQWAARSVDELLGELTQEAADIGAWGVSALEQLREDNSAGDGRTQRVGGAARGHDRLRRPGPRTADPIAASARDEARSSSPRNGRCMPGRCRTCTAPLRWARMARTGRPHPLDLDATERGTVKLLGDGRGEVLTGPELLQARDAGVELFLEPLRDLPGPRPVATPRTPPGSGAMRDRNVLLVATGSIAPLATALGPRVSVTETGGRPRNGGHGPGCGTAMSLRGSVALPVRG